MTIADAILHDLLADESKWWAGELQTVTGFYVAEYRDLAKRMNEADYRLTQTDRGLLYGAAMALVYSDPPYLEAKKTRSMFGDDWEKRIDEFMILMRDKK